MYFFIFFIQKHYILAGCAVFFFIFSSISAQEFTVEDIQDGYKYNVSNFLQARVIFQEDVKYLTKFSGKTKQLQVTWSLDFWSDGYNSVKRGHHQVSPKNPEINSNQNFNLPIQTKANFSSEDLIAHYSNIPVETFFAADGLYRIWLGDSSNGEKQAYISQTSSKIENPYFRQPPFLNFISCTQKLFPCDSFFSFPIKNTFILGIQELEGKKFLVAEHRTELPQMTKMYEGFIKGTKYESRNLLCFDLFTAWISLEQGYIPIRIEKTTAFLENGKLPNEDTLIRIPKHEKADWCFTVNDVKEISTGVFYPMKAKQTFYTSDPSHQSNFSPYDFIEGRVSKTPRLVTEEVEWTIHKVDLNVNISENTLKFSFPKDTLVYNEITNTVGKQGVSQDEFLKEIEREIEQVDRKNNGIINNFEKDEKLKEYKNNHNFYSGYRHWFFSVGLSLIIAAIILKYLISRFEKND